MTDTASVLTKDDELIVATEGSLGVIRLNRPKALNALTLDMVRFMSAALDRFEAEHSIGVILLEGAGERGLCAGGDIRGLYDSIRAGGDLGKVFWREEYILNARIAALKKRCARAGIPAVYVNDNFGKWRSDFKTLVSHCLKDEVRGEEVVELLKPDRDDYFVLKPKHSGFYSTTLDLLLEHLGAKALILTGFTGDICILFTACDAFLRDYRLLIPSDCVVSEDEKENTAALKYMQRVLEANIGPAADINLRALAETHDAKGQQPNCCRGQHK